jgi:hypothetical protein
LIALLAAAGSAAQMDHSQMDHSQMDHSQMDHSQMDHSQMHSDMGSMPMDMSPSSTFLMGETSGTAFQPLSWPMPMIMKRAGSWSLMWMGQAFVVDTQQSGPRGGDKFYSTNWGMLSGVRSVGAGSLLLRAMVSLEPATITERRYPLLFQTGETAYGRPLVDAQHPHDLLMELSIQYARAIGDKVLWNVYYAPVGEPALGPVAYPHRASAMELPQATLGHHWEDSTHIADNVATFGVSFGKFRAEGSGFHGREPDENRWNLDFGRIDSWSARFSAAPNRNWTAQVSTGRLSHPEPLQAGDVQRTTASLEYVKSNVAAKAWASSIVWGQDYEKDRRRAINAFLTETVVPLGTRNFVTGRYEWSQRDELFENAQFVPQAIAGAAYSVNAFTGGYTRDVEVFRSVESGIGANISAYAIADALKPFYGSHPWSVNVFLRLRAIGR